MNGYQQAPGVQPPEENLPIDQMGFSEGFRGDLDAALIPLDASPSLDHIRIEEGKLRRDWGSLGIGVAAAYRILGLLDHKYLSAEEEQVHRIVRISRTATGKAFVELWDGAAWNPLQLSLDSINDSLLSTASIQGVVVFTNGTYILAFAENTDEDVGSDDFTVGEIHVLRGVNPLDLEGVEPTTPVIPAGGAGDEYHITFGIKVYDAAQNVYRVVVAIKVEGVEVDTREILIGPISRLGEYALEGIDEQGGLIEVDVVTPISTGQDLSLAIKEVQDVDVDPTIIGEVGNPAYRITDANGGVGLFTGGRLRNNDIDITMRHVGFPTGTINFYWSNDGAVWNLIAGEEIILDGSEPAVTSHTITVPDAVYTNLDNQGEPLKYLGAKFTAGYDPADFVYIETLEFALDPYVSIEGASGDPNHGVEYTGGSALESYVERLSADAPRASYIFPFGDRLIALRDGAEVASVAWSADGDITDWVGGDSGQIYPVDTRADPLDEMMAGAAIGQNVAALFRRRSIMRMFETGNVAQAIGAVHWIDYMGTDAAHSVRGVNGGAIFLGQDRMIYYLTPAGLKEIGRPILHIIKALADDRIEWVDSAYNPKTGEYFLGLPVEHATKATEVWVFDLNFFLASGKVQWRKRTIVAERLSVVSEV